MDSFLFSGLFSGSFFVQLPGFGFAQFLVQRGIAIVAALGDDAAPHRLQDLTAVLLAVGAFGVFALSQAIPKFGKGKGGDPPFP